MTKPPKVQILTDAEMESKFSEVQYALAEGCKITRRPRVYSPNPSTTIVKQKREWDVLFSKGDTVVVSMKVWEGPDGEERRRIQWFEDLDGVTYFHSLHL